MSFQGRLAAAQPVFQYWGHPFPVLLYCPLLTIEYHSKTFVLNGVSSTVLHGALLLLISQMHGVWCSCTTKWDHVSTNTDTFKKLCPSPCQFCHLQSFPASVRFSAPLPPCCCHRPTTHSFPFFVTLGVTRDIVQPSMRAFNVFLPTKISTMSTNCRSGLWHSTSCHVKISSFPQYCKSVAPPPFLQISQLVCP